MAGNKKATAPVPSVAADGKQSLCNKHKEIIADLPPQGNLQATNNRVFCAEIQTEKKVGWID